jgi:alpha-galactosidase
MPKIALIGAGSAVFTRNLASDILLVPELQGSTIALMDIDAGRLALARDLVQKMVDERHLPATVEATLDRREAIRGARYVVVTIQVGGLDAYALDIEIPQKYGVGQCVGDTLGPGGVFRGLRTIPVLLDICRDMDDLAAPDALLINYSNPMAINCWAVANGSGRPHVGYCHSVQGTSEMLADWIGAPYEQISFRCFGINHQAWFVELKWKGKDAYPLLRQAIQRQEIIEEEPVRVELMKQFGYFVTESSGHASEYVPYLRKSEAMILDELVPRFARPNYDWIKWGRTGGYLAHCQERAVNYLDEVKEQIAGARPLPSKRSHEYGSYTIEAMETGKPTIVHGNVPNSGLITNLPQGACVEVACLVDKNGIRPTVAGALPPQLAALNRAMINVQELAVFGSLKGDCEAIQHAVMMDPLTAAVCTLPQIRSMVDELFTAEARWLPQFA